MADEKRRHRTSFTRSLQRVAERIDRTFEFEIEWQNVFDRRKEKTKFCVKTLWAFGSWAKGALFCGDLDLIVDVEVTEGFIPMASALRSVLINGARDVRLYVGNPEKIKWAVSEHVTSNSPKRFPAEPSSVKAVSLGVQSIITNNSQEH